MELLKKRVPTIVAFLITTLAAGAGVALIKANNIDISFKLKETALKKGIIVLLPANNPVSSPLEIKGYINGNNWAAFEGQAGRVELKDDNNEILASSVLAATSDWMKPVVYFKTELEFAKPKTETGSLVFYNENPSGNPSRERQFIITIKFTGLSEDTIRVKVYLSNSRLDPEVSCDKVFPIERIIPKTSAIARAATEELLKGPTEAEKKQGYFANINQGVIIQKLSIENDTAKIDFNEQLQFQVGGSCRVSAIKAQITETLKQFPSVKEVVISINGRTEDILQP